MRLIVPKQPDTRVVNRFLFLPKRLGNEIRWLEKAKILQVAVKLEGTWLDHAFVDDK